jgi:hypothetical protein
MCFRLSSALEPPETHRKDQLDPAAGSEREKRPTKNYFCRVSKYTLMPVDDARLYSVSEANSFFARQYNGACWSYLAKDELSTDDMAKMVSLAHASLVHWAESKECTPANLQRGEWLVATAYAYANRGDPAYLHARRCVDLTLAHPDSMMGFDSAYAYMVMARTSALIGLDRDAEIFLSKMVEAIPQIVNSKDKEIFIGDLGAGPWNSIAGLVRETIRSL